MQEENAALLDGWLLRLSRVLWLRLIMVVVRGQPFGQLHEPSGLLQAADQRLRDALQAVVGPCKLASNPSVLPKAHSAASRDCSACPLASMATRRQLPWAIASTSPSGSQAADPSHQGDSSACLLSPCSAWASSSPNQPAEASAARAPVTQRLGSAGMTRREVVLRMTQAPLEARGPHHRETPAKEPRPQDRTCPSLASQP